MRIMHLKFPLPNERFHHIGPNQPTCITYFYTRITLLLLYAYAIIIRPTRDIRPTLGFRYKYSINGNPRGLLRYTHGQVSCFSKPLIRSAMSWK